MRAARVPALLLLIAALAPACRKPSVQSNASPPSLNPPTVTVTTPAGLQTGIIPISYTLIDVEGNRASIVVEWSRDAGATWAPATRALLGGDGTTKLTTSSTGVGHVFMWDSAVDGAGKPALETVRLRITPSDKLVGTPGTADFDVDNQVTVFRIDTMVLRDPHIFFNFGGCQDVTDSGAGIPGADPGGINGGIAKSLTTDDDGDGFIDSSPLLLFRLFNQAGTGGKLEFASGRFAPATPTTGDLMPGTGRVTSTYTNVAAGTILSPGSGTTRPYSPPVAEPSGPGFVTVAVTYSIPSGNLTIPLEGYQVAGTYQGDPATGIVSGLSKGFISETIAQQIIIDLGTGSTTTLAALLPGGPGNCNGIDDRDTGPDGVTVGWWFYYNWTAQKVTYTGP